MRRLSGRAFAIGGLAAGVAAALVAVLAALAAPTPTVTQAKAADITVRVRQQANGSRCFTVGGVAATQTCVRGLQPDEIRYAATGSAIGGLAGLAVRAVIVKLTRKGTVWATLRGGTFSAAIPAGYRVRTVIKVLANGRRTAFPVR
jgi:hypothetical protein